MGRKSTGNDGKVHSSSLNIN